MERLPLASCLPLKGCDWLRGQQRFDWQPDATSKTQRSQHLFDLISIVPTCSFSELLEYTRSSLRCVLHTHLFQTCIHTIHTTHSRTPRLSSFSSRTYKHRVNQKPINPPCGWEIRPCPPESRTLPVVPWSCLIRAGERATPSEIQEHTHTHQVSCRANERLAGPPRPPGSTNPAHPSAVVNLSAPQAGGCVCCVCVLCRADTQSHMLM